MEAMEATEVGRIKDMVRILNQRKYMNMIK